MTVADELVVRVSVPDVWDSVRLRVAPDWTVARLKAAALEAATGRREDPTLYVVKYRGARVLDEDQSLAALDIPNDVPFIVLRAGRQPVR